MESKPKNVFEKLDKQGETIEDISQRLQGISINDLYALAKRTWDYGDFQTAQKYYNHISLLKPLDWEAPLYASLCNFRGYHDMYFWTKVPEQAEKIIVSTIKYINNLDLNDDKKEAEMTKCIEIIKKDMLRTKEHYFKYKKNYDDTDYDYIYALEEYYLNVCNEIKDINLNSLKGFIIELADIILSLIQATKKISLKITKEVFDELTITASKSFDIDYDAIIEKNKDFAKPKEDLSLDEIKEIKLKGKMYFEYKDKVISKRNYKNKILTSSLLIMLSLAGIVLSSFLRPLLSLLFVLPSLYGLYLLSAAFLQKEKISCASFFTPKRIYNRLTSNGDIVTEGKKNIVNILFLIGSSVLISLGVFFSFLIFNIKDKDFVLKISLVVTIISTILIYYLSILKFSSEYHSKNNGIYSYFYKGKYYKFDS